MFILHNQVRSQVLKGVRENRKQTILLRKCSSVTGCHAVTGCHTVTGCHASNIRQVYTSKLENAYIREYIRPGVEVYGVLGCSKCICVQHLKRHKRLNGEIWEQGAVCLNCSAKAVVSGQPIKSVLMPTLQYEACPLDENTPWFKRF